MRVKSFTENLAKKNRNKSGVHSSQNELNVADTVKKDNNIDNYEIESFQDEETSSFPSNQQNCQHFNKAVNNLSFLKKVLKTQAIGQCTSCLDLKNKGHDIQVKKEAALWFCLSCGHQGCDRSSEHQHAMKHYMTPRSTLHCVVLNIDSFVVWCYKCDEEIHIYGKRVEEIVNSIKKICSQESQNTNNDRSSNENVNKLDQTNSTPIATRVNQHNFLKKQEQQLAITQNNVPISINNANSSNIKVNGLNNLGNTCFFNAVLQNLAQTPNLDSLLLEVINSKDKNEIIQSTFDYESDSSTDLSECDDNLKKDDDFDSHKINNKKVNHGFNKVDQLSISLNDAGAITYNLFSLIKEMNGSLRSSISPGALFSLICKKVPSFKGFQQQDSHELLRHLLDAIKNEEIKRRQFGILNAFNCNPRNVDETIKQKIKNYGRLINYTCIDSLFGGHLLSTVLCEQCKTCSQNIEPFLDLSLPIVDDKTVSNKLSPIEDFNEDTYISKHKLKKQKKISKKNKGKNQARTKSASKHTNEEDELQTNVMKQHASSINNSISDEDQEEVNDEEANDHENALTMETEDNESNKIGNITLALNDALVQNDVLNNNYKLEAMQSLSKRSLSTIQEDDNSSCSLQSFLLKFTSHELLAGTNKFGCENCTRSSYRKLNSNSNNANSIPKEIKTVYTQAVKQYLICELPAILTIHLKRFQQHGFRLEKVNKHVNFPLELDMAPYTSKMCNNLNGMGKVLYSLYGIVEHSGRLNGGHYTAYIKARQKQNLEKLLGKKRLAVLKPTVSINSSTSSSNIGETEACINETNINECAQSSNTSTWYYISDSSVSEVPESKILKLQAYILFYERISAI